MSEASGETVDPYHERALAFATGVASEEAEADPLADDDLAHLVEVAVKAYCEFTDDGLSEVGAPAMTGRADERIQPPKHPFGRLATLRHGAWTVASGLVTLLTLGEVQPRWTLDDAFRTAYRAHNKQRLSAGKPEPA